MKSVAIFAGLGIILGLYGCSTYNKLVARDEAVKAQWATVESQYQRRVDLIPNLVNVVKGYAAHEKGVFEAVSNARAKASSVQIDPSKLSDPNAVKQFEQAQGQLTGALRGLIAISERYPDLKAEPRFADLQSQIEGTENRIAVERRKYNEVVQDYNTVVRSFPTSFVAGLGHFQVKVPFTVTTPGAQNAPTVQF